MDIRTQQKIKRFTKKAHSYFILSLIVVVGASYYSFTKYIEYKSVKASIASHETALYDLQTRLNEEIDFNFNLAESQYLEQRKDGLEEIRSVFPPLSEYRRLTRQLEQWFEDHNRSNQPMELNSLSFGSPSVPVDAEYSVLPLTMSVRVSEKNFFELLKFLETSGSFEGKTRLMSLESISFSLPDGGDESTAPNVLNLSLQVNAYFQKEA